MARTRTRLPAALALAALCAAASCRQYDDEPRPTGTPSADDYGPVGDFRLTERSGRPVLRGELLGKVWVASFVFTRCTGPCPQVTGTMARLQAELKNESDVRLVTFTVDPARDDPAELAKYAEQFGADPKRWLFLTGPEADIYRLVRDSFHLTAQPTTGAARTPGNEVEHSTKLAVVDRRGHVRGYFDGTRDTRMPDADKDFEANLARLKEKVVLLAGEGAR
jgi:cytochrome oxidase Cu insertion factor (SCO1/SenC/PrrC family)